MAVIPTEFVVSAKSLLSGASEIDFRNAASRAYYGAYHSALPAADYCPDMSHLAVGFHARLIAAFEEIERKSPLKSKGMSIAYSLRQLRSVREKADYDIDINFTAIEAEAQVVLTDKLLDRVENFINEAQRLVA